jgi:hypothetical protein
VNELQAYSRIYHCTEEPPVKNLRTRFAYVIR